MKPLRAKSRYWLTEVAAAFAAAIALSADVIVLSYHPTGVFQDLGNDVPIGTKIAIAAGNSPLAANPWLAPAATAVVGGCLYWLSRKKGDGGQRRTFNWKVFVLLAFALFLVLGGIVAFVALGPSSSSELVK